MRSFVVMLGHTLCRIMQFSQCHTLANYLTFVTKEGKQAQQLFPGVVVMSGTSGRMSDVFNELSVHVFQTDEYIFLRVNMLFSYVMILYIYNCADFRCANFEHNQSHLHDPFRITDKEMHIIMHEVIEQEPKEILINMVV